MERFRETMARSNKYGLGGLLIVEKLNAIKYFKMAVGDNKSIDTRYDEVIKGYFELKENF